MTTADSVLGVVPAVLVGGSALPQSWMHELFEVRVERGLRVAGRATIRFRDPELELIGAKTVKLGAAVKVAARRPYRGDGPQDIDLLEGFVTGIALEQGSRGIPELVVVAHDAAYAFGRQTTRATHLLKTAGDLVGEIAGRYGLTSTVSGSGAGRQHEYLMQAQTDLELLDHLADRSGCDWWVDGTRLHFAPVARSGYPTVSTRLGWGLADLTVRASGLRPDQVSVSGWDRKAKQEVDAHAAASSVDPGSGARRFAQHVGGSGLKPAKPVLRTVSPPVISAQEATDLAQALAEDLVTAGLTASGTLVDGAGVKPGTPLDVDAPDPVGGTFVVTTVEHVFRDGFRTRFTAGDRRPSSLVETLGRGGSGSHQYGGLVVGIVTNVNDKDGLGRVKVKFAGRMEHHESQWARVLSLGAGGQEAKTRGLVVMPEVNDEVLVGFEGGDLRQPVVLGGLFSSVSKPPDVGIADDVRARSLTSRHGHVIELSDGTTPDKQYALVELEGKKHHLKIAKDAVELVMPAGVPFTLKVGDTGLLQFDKSGSLTIKAVNVTIEAKGSFKVDATGAAEVKAKATATLEGEIMAAVKGGMVDVNGKGPVTVKGAMVAIN